ncbi:MAG: DNRLRE domain-containing protein, partial [Gammaproteobacteria bacterium]
MHYCTVRKKHLTHTSRQSTQRGYILLPVVLALILLATIASLINREGAIHADMVANTTETVTVEHVARTGLAHAVWGVQNSGCAGDLAMTSVPFGEGGTNSYTATVVTGGATTTQYTFNPDRDGFIDEGSADQNHSGDATTKVKDKLDNVRQALYHYDLSSIPTDRKVVTATAWFYVDSEDKEGAVTLHPVTADWTEANLTWNAIGGHYESGVYGSFPPQPAKDVWVSFNVTALAQNWVSNPTGNYGFLLNATSIDNESQYTSREYGTLSLRPYLEVTTADAAVSPVQISATGTLTGNPSPANDITRTLTRPDVPAYQPASTLNLQLSDTGGGKDTLIDDFYPIRNYGGASYLQINSQSGWFMAPLIQFDLPDLPPGARVLEARLELLTLNVNTGGTATVHRVTRDWVEGTRNGGGIADGATWETHDGTNAWAQPGGEYVPLAAAATDIPAGMSGWGVSWDIAALVQEWIDGTVPNYGLMLRGDGVLNNAQFNSRETNNPVDRPRLTLTWACECGSPCLAPQGSGKVLLVVDNKVAMLAADVYKKALLESWGYSVTLIADNAAQSDFNTELGAHDVVYISETVDPASMAGKLSNAPTGIVSEEGLLNDDLGIS